MMKHSFTRFEKMSVRSHRDSPSTSLVNSGISRLLGGSENLASMCVHLFICYLSGNKL